MVAQLRDMKKVPSSNLGVGIMSYRYKHRYTYTFDYGFFWNGKNWEEILEDQREVLEEQKLRNEGLFMARNRQDPIQSIEDYAKAMGMRDSALKMLRQVVDEQEEYVPPSSRMSWLNPVQELSETGEVIEESPMVEEKPKSKFLVYGGFMPEGPSLGQGSPKQPLTAKQPEVPVKVEDVPDNRPPRRMRFD